MSRRSRLVWIAACLLCLAFVAYELAARIKWVGQFTTTLRIESDRHSLIRQVTWDTGARADEIQQAVEHLRAGAPEQVWHFRHGPVRLPDDGFVEIKGWTAGSESPFRIVSNNQAYERFVILKIEFEDGMIVYKWVEVHPTDRASVTVVHISADEPAGVGHPP